MSNPNSAHLCPVCQTPAATTTDAFACWNSHDPGFWDRIPRKQIAARLGCTGPRVSQILLGYKDGKRKQYIWS